MMNETQPTISQPAIILQQVGQERARQDAKWGEQSHPDVSPAETGQADWILAEEAEADAARAVNEDNIETGNTNWKDILDEEIHEAYVEAHKGDQLALRNELIQSAAVALAWVEDIDRREAARRNTNED